MPTNVEVEAALLQRYWEEAKVLCDRLMEVSPQEEKPLRSEIDRRLGIYWNQLGAFKSRFPDDIRGAIYESCFYQLQAMQLLGTSSGFRRVPGRSSSLAVAITSNALAKSQEKKNAYNAIALLDKANSIFDEPNSRVMKAQIYRGLGATDTALRELHYVLNKFPDDPMYLEARSLIDEIQNPPKKGMCFVATAACGSPLAAEVLALSRYRDEVLLATWAGKVFVRVYYRLSPPLAALIAQSDAVRSAVRTLFLRPVVRVVERALSKRAPRRGADSL